MYVKNTYINGKEGRTQKVCRSTLKTIINWPWKCKLKLSIYVTAALFCPQQNSCGVLGFSLAFEPGHS